jgi:hypothetical protein
MKKGSTFDDAGMQITATVHVLNPTDFVDNLRERAKMTRKQWGELDASADEDANDTSGAMVTQ